MVRHGWELIDALGIAGLFGRNGNETREHGKTQNIDRLQGATLQALFDLVARQRHREEFEGFLKQADSALTE